MKKLRGQSDLGSYLLVQFTDQALNSPGQGSIQGRITLSMASKDRSPQSIALQAEFPRVEFPRTGFSRAWFPRAGFQRAGFPRVAFPRVGFPRVGFPRAGFPRSSFSQYGSPGQGSLQSSVPKKNT